MIGWDFPTRKEIAHFVIVIFILGAGILKLCECGCDYVGSKVELKWK